MDKYFFKDIVSKLYKGKYIYFLIIAVLLGLTLGLFNVEQRTVDNQLLKGSYKTQKLVKDTREYKDKNKGQNKDRDNNEKGIEINNSVGADSCGITAVLYDDYTYTSNGISLTSEGATISNWQYETSKYLAINVTADVEDGKTHVVEVELPKELYFVTTDIDYLPAGFKSTSFERVSTTYISGFSGETGFDLQETSGKLTYVLDKNIEVATINLEVRYDTKLWDKLAGSDITRADVKPINITYKHMEDTSCIDNISIRKATAGEGTNPWNWETINNGAYNYKDTKTKYIRYHIVDTNDMYLKDCYITYNLPYYEYKGTKYYLELNTNTADGPGVEFMPLIVSDDYNGYIMKYDENTHKLSFYIEDFACYADDVYITLPLKMPSNIPSNLEEEIGGNDIYFAGGIVTVTGMNNNGKNITYMEYPMDKRLYQINPRPNIDLWDDYRYVYYNTTKDGVALLGAPWIANSGGVDSSEVTLKYEFPDELLVTTLNLLSEVDSKKHTIYYKLKDDDGEAIYFDTAGNPTKTKTSTTTEMWSVDVDNYNYGCDLYENIKITFNRSNLPKLHQQYYFKEIEYTFATIYANAKQWDQGGNESTNSAGNYYGYVSKNAVIGEEYDTVFSISTNDGPTNNETEIVTTYITDKENTSAFLDIYEIDDDVMAGESIHVTGEFGGITYCYGNTNLIKNINMGLLLPIGVNINDDSIMLYNELGRVKHDRVYIKDTVDGYNMWVIEINLDRHIGYYSEKLAKVGDTGRIIEFEMDLDTEVTMQDTNIYIKDTFMTACAKNNTYSTGWNYTIGDKLDINNNGIYDEELVGIGIHDDRVITIKGNPVMIRAVDNTTITGDGSVVDNKVTLKSALDKIVYSTTIERVEVGTLNEFAQYIMIPKKSSLQDKFLVTNEADERFDFILSDVVTLSGSNIFEVLYTVEESLDFNAAIDMDENKWLDENTFLKQYDISDVTMVKIVLKDGKSVTEDFAVTVNVPMIVSGAENRIEENKVNKWISRAYYDFTYGGGRVAGYFSTNGAEAEIGYVPTEDDVTDSPKKSSDNTVGGEELDDTPDTSDRMQLEYWIYMMIISTIGLVVSKKYLYNNIR